MVELLPDVRDDIIAVKASGKLTKNDYDEVIAPRVETIAAKHAGAKFLFIMDKDFRGWDFFATLHYARLGLKHLNRFDKIAAVCGPKWVHWFVKVQQLFIKGKVATFKCGQDSDAYNWISS